MNNFSSVCNICRDPEALELGGRTCMKMRLADNTFGRNNKPMYFDAIFSGPDVETVQKLATGNEVFVSGTLCVTEYKSNKTKKMEQAFSIPFAKLLRVTKSPQFFGEHGSGDGDGPSTPEQGSDDVPELNPEDSPLAGIAD